MYCLFLFLLWNCWLLPCVCSSVRHPCFYFGKYSGSGFSLVLALTIAIYLFSWWTWIAVVLLFIIWRGRSGYWRSLRTCGGRYPNRAWFGKWAYRRSASLLRGIGHLITPHCEPSRFVGETEAAAGIWPTGINMILGRLALLETIIIIK